MLRERNRFYCRFSGRAARIIIVYGVWFYAAVTAFGQNSQTPVGQDNQPPVRENIPDTSKIQRLQHAIQENFNSDRVDQELVLLDSLLTAPFPSGQFAFQPYRLMHSGLAAWKRQSFEAALDTFRLAVNAFDDQQTVMSIQSVLGGMRTFYLAAGKHSERLEFYQQKLKYYLKNGPLENTGACYHGIAGHYLSEGLYENAIENYLKAAEVARGPWPREYVNELAVVGGCYADWGNPEKAKEYLLEAKKLATALKGWSNLNYCLRHLAELSEASSEYAQAQQYAAEGLEIARREKDTTYQLLFLVVKGRVASQQRAFTDAGKWLHEAEALRLQSQAPFYSTHGAVELDYAWFLYYNKQGNDPSAENHMLKALHQAEQNRLNSLRLNYYREAAGFYDTNGNLSKSLVFFRKYANLRDSLNKIDNLRRVAQFEYDLADQQKSGEMALVRREFELQRRALRQRNTILLVVGGAVFLLGIFLAVISRQLHLNRRQNLLLKKQKETIDAERRKSEELLFNILPEEVAHELKMHNRVNGRLYEQVTVIITDFVDFTSLTEQLSPHDLIRELDTCFRAFDAIVGKHHLEKIKTVGDGYIAAAGVPTPAENHAERAVRAAVDMAAFVQEYRREGGAFSMRVGVHTGPVIAGIVGAKKFAYDIWGDTVNVAARLEKAGAPGKINISGETYNLVQQLFDFEHRGRIAIKGKGEIDMYFVLEETD